MGQSSSQVQKEEDIDQPSTDRFTPFDSTAEKETTIAEKIESDTLTPTPTQSTNNRKPDPFLTPLQKRRYSFEIRVPSPADFMMARPSDVPMSEPANPAKRKRTWEDNNDAATSPPSARRVKIKDRLSINNLIDVKEGREHTASTQGSTSTQNPYGKRKRNNRGKHLPPGFRPGHISLTNAKRTGLFSPDEIETLEQHKLWFCNKYHITADMFDASVQSAQSSKNGIFLEETPIVKYRDFWQAIYETIPARDQKSINRFCRRHFSNAYKPHQWTKEDDDELERLQALYGTKWASIARDMERTYDDVVQRWKNKVELRHTMKKGPWDDDEIYKLIECLEETRRQHLNTGRPEEELGKDIYEMPDEFCGWGSICKRFEGTRSRQQLADKWRKIKRIVLERREDGYEDAVWDPSLQPRPGPRSKYKSLPVLSEDRKFLSKETVDSSDEGEDQNTRQSKKENKNENKAQRAKANGTAQPEVKESANESSDSSSEEDDSDESSSDEENDAIENGNKDGEDDVVDQSAGDETPRPQTNGYHVASDNESVVPESQVDESEAEESQASSSRNTRPKPTTNGNAVSGRQPSEELGVVPVSAQEEAPETEEDSQDSEEEEEEISENAGEDIKPPSSQSKAAKSNESPIIEREERHSSPSDSEDDSDSDDGSRDGSSSGSSSEDESDEESEEELSPEEIEKKIFKFKKEPEDD